MLPEGQDWSKSAAGLRLKWVEEHGITPDCGACKSIEVNGTRKGKNHSKGCCERYWNWMKAQASEQTPKTPAKVPDLGLKNVPPEEKDDYEPDLDEFKPSPPGRLEVVPVNTSSSYGPDFGDGGVDILGMDDPVSSPDQKRESTAVEPEPCAKKVRFTRGCPACESGMNAPGIRRSASCKKAFETSSSPSVEPVRQDPGDVAMEGSTEGLAADTEFARITRLKRSLCRNLRRRLQIR